MNKLALVFPGQGSQSVGMLASLCASHGSLIKSLFAKGSDIVGCDLFDLISNGPVEKLNQTEFTQVALLISGVACYSIWQQESGIKPNYLAGHSLGEYTALVCAAALSLEEGITLVQTRAKLMQQAVPAGSGAMAAIIGLHLPLIQDICMTIATKEFIVAPANLNNTMQTVISGHTAAVEQAAELAKQKGAKLVVMLPVSVPSHCALMEAIGKDFCAALNNVNWQTPTIPVMHNYDLKMYQQVEHIKHALIMQLSNPVRWLELIEKLISFGVTEIAECGPGQVLTGLNKKITAEANCTSLGIYSNMHKFSQLCKNGHVLI